MSRVAGRFLWRISDCEDWRWGRIQSSRHLIQPIRFLASSHAVVLNARLFAVILLCALVFSAFGKLLSLENVFCSYERMGRFGLFYALRAQSSLRLPISRRYDLTLGLLIPRVDSAAYTRRCSASLRSKDLLAYVAGPLAVYVPTLLERIRHRMSRHPFEPIFAVLSASAAAVCDLRRS